VALKADGTLWAWGYNWHGQLGDGSQVNGQPTPTQVGTGSDWVAVSCGENYTVAMKADGTLWAWGSNSYGQLGYDTANDADPGFSDMSTIPQQVGDASDWAAVACGSYHTLAIKADGSLWAWGYNYFGQLGDGTVVDRTIPTQVSGATWASVACGSRHTAAIRADGTLWTWGDNAYGELGYDTAADADPLYSDQSSVPQSVDGAWASVACGSFHTAGSTDDGLVWAWGSNYFGQLGDGTTANRGVPTGVFNLW
jgi:alpha-tubulin suppressor-like RCC1 family protein